MGVEKKTTGDSKLNATLNTKPFPTEEQNFSLKVKNKKKILADLASTSSSREFSIF